jgi:hypothetical protein
MVYLLCALLGSGVLLALCVPLFRKENGLESTILEETQWDLLQRKKEVVLGNIQDLDFEYKCGKLSDEDYKGVRGEMAGEFGAVLREIDEIETTQDLDALIRRELAGRKKRPAAHTTDNGKVTEHSCPSCGTMNPATNRFCAECGAKLKVR